MRMIVLALTTACGVLHGCGPTDDASDANADAPAPAVERTSDWRVMNDVPVIATDATTDDPAFADAVRTARESLDAARLRFNAVADDDARGRWAVKWAARTLPTDDGEPGVEYVWVIPRTWSAYRIEGWLANEPQHDLECARGLHEIVSFPIEEVVDWRRAPDPNDPTDRVEGAWTTRALESRHGRTAHAKPEITTPAP